MPPRSAMVVIRRPVDDVFAYMNDVSREAEWQPHLLEAEETPPGATRVGSERRYVSEFMGRRVENVYVVTDFDPPERVRLETTASSSIDAVSEIRWEPVADGTRVTMSVDASPKGALRFVPRALLEATFERELEGALGRLKDVMERAS